MCDISAYALFSQILSFILLTWKQNFWLILILLNPERDKNTNLDINYKAFLPYNNHWFYIEKNDFDHFWIDNCMFLIFMVKNEIQDSG